MAALDPVIHAPNRLQICAFLSPLEEAEFQVLRDDLGVSDSVLSKHVKQLEDAGYIEQLKRKAGGRQRTWLALTPEGRKALRAHVAALEVIVAAAKGVKAV